MRSPSCSIGSGGVLIDELHADITWIPCWLKVQKSIAPELGPSPWAQDQPRTAHHYTGQYCRVSGVVIRWKKVVGGSWEICPLPQIVVQMS
eukprot:183923-Karenia_brevis.AAC.1